MQMCSVLPSQTQPRAEPLPAFPGSELPWQGRAREMSEQEFHATVVRSNELNPPLEGRKQHSALPSFPGQPGQAAASVCLFHPGTGHHKITCRCFLQSFPMGYAYPHCRGLGNLLLSYHISCTSTSWLKENSRKTAQLPVLLSLPVLPGAHVFPDWQPASHSKTPKGPTAAL